MRRYNFNEYGFDWYHCINIIIFSIIFSFFLKDQNKLLYHLFLINMNAFQEKRKDSSFFMIKLKLELTLLLCFKNFCLELWFFSQQKDFLKVLLQRGDLRVWSFFKEKLMFNQENISFCLMCLDIEMLSLLIKGQLS